MLLLRVRLASFKTRAGETALSRVRSKAKRPSQWLRLWLTCCASAWSVVTAVAELVLLLLLLLTVTLLAMPKALVVLLTPAKRPVIKADIKPLATTVLKGNGVKRKGLLVGLLLVGTRVVAGL